MNAEFEATQWTLILTSDAGSGERRSLEHLCKAYWKPLYGYVRSLGCTHEDAEDSIQGFFKHLIESDLHQRADRERGRFRTFIQMTLRNYVSKQRRNANAQKRGGGEAHHLELDAAEDLLGDAAPDVLFDKRWALSLLEQALIRLEKEQPNPERFAMFKPLLTDDERGTTLEIAKQLGMSDVAARTTLSRLRARYRELIRAEVRRLVDDAADVDKELAHLMEALGS